MLEQRQATYLRIEELHGASFNVRKSVGDVSKLADPIRMKGVQQRLQVRPIGSKSEVIVGPRRYAAAKKVGLKEPPVIIKNFLDENALVEPLSEDIQRNNPGPMELTSQVPELDVPSPVVDDSDASLPSRPGQSS